MPDPRRLQQLGARKQVAAVVPSRPAGAPLGAPHPGVAGTPSLARPGGSFGRAPGPALALCTRHVRSRRRRTPDSLPGSAGRPASRSTAPTTRGQFGIRRFYRSRRFQIAGGSWPSAALRAGHSGGDQAGRGAEPRPSSRELAQGDAASRTPSSWGCQCATVAFTDAPAEPDRAAADEGREVDQASRDVAEGDVQLHEPGDADAASGRSGPHAEAEQADLLGGADGPGVSSSGGEAATTRSRSAMSSTRWSRSGEDPLHPRRAGVGLVDRVGSSTTLIPWRL